MVEIILAVQKTTIRLFRRQDWIPRIVSDLSEGGVCTEKHVEIVRYRVLNLRLLETHGTAEVLEPRFECLENEKTAHFC